MACIRFVNEFSTKTKVWSCIKNFFVNVQTLPLDLALDFGPHEGYRAQGVNCEASETQDSMTLASGKMGPNKIESENKDYFNDDECTYKLSVHTKAYSDACS